MPLVWHRFPNYCTAGIVNVQSICRYLTERKFAHEVWFLYYPEEANKRGAPVQLMRGVEFGLETKALLFKRLCAYAGLHAHVVKVNACANEAKVHLI